MFDFEDFKNEIVESINEVKKEQEKTNEFYEKVFEKKEHVSDDESPEVEEDTEEDIEEDIEEILEIFEEEQTVEEILIENNTLLLEKLDEMKTLQLESSWLISLIIVTGLGFHYFINQFSKW